MSRFRRIVHGVASGYISLAAASIYSLATVPLALHYLSRERFALWALMSSIGNYLSLVDLGMSGSVARLLIDHKDHRKDGTYGSFVKTGWLVLAVQGLIIWSVGFVLAPLLSHLLAIPANLQTEFIALMRWQTTTLALSFATRIFSHILQAHQRTDMVNYCQVVMLGLGFVLLWTFFHAGQEIFSLVWTGLIGLGCSAIVLITACARLGFFPSPGEWGRASWHHFSEMFRYGKDLFLVAVGNQLILASQTMIITRRLGLETAALWAIGTRVFMLVSQIIWRVFDVSSLALAEMIVRGELARLRERYQALVISTASLSALAASGYVLCNSPFVSLWTHNRFEWPPGNDVLLGLWMMVMAVLHCHNCFVLTTKKVGAMPYVYFIEGLVFVGAALLVAKSGGLPALIACSVLCSTFFSGAYGIRRISDYFNLPVAEVAVRWLMPMARVLVLFAPAAFVTWWAFRGVSDPIIRLAAGVLATGFLGMYLFLRFGLSRAVQLELLERLPKSVNPVLRRIFPVSAS